MRRVPATFHDLTPLHELAYVLPKGAKLFKDKGYISDKDAKTIEKDTGVKVVSVKRKNMKPNFWLDQLEARTVQKRDRNKKFTN
jgi:hypothetical protein